MKIYMLGIGGVAMGNLASLLKAAGHQVSGSDAQVYPPMSDFLKERGIEYRLGFAVENIPKTVDLAVIGNVVSMNNDEMGAIRERKIPFLSLPQTIQKYLLPGSESIVIAGTHGKTTTTALITHTLQATGHAPGFLLGGIANNFGSGSALGDAKQRPHYFVLEGDEYDSAYFQKEPKFLSYQPQHLIITSLEFDHADIYPNLAEIEKQFSKLVSIVPKSGHILVCSDYANAVGISKTAKAKVYTYGKKKSDHFYLRKCRQRKSPQRSEFSFYSEPHQREVALSIPLIGEFNVLNALAVSGLLMLLGVAVDQLQVAFESFKGVRRRQQQLFSNDHFTVIEDFAHHPTAMRLTLEALRAAYPKHELWVLFEPRSNTTRRNFFQESYPEALAVADQVILYKVYNAAAIPEDQRLNREIIADRLKILGKRCDLPESVKSIVETIKALKPLPDGQKRLLAIMTNGDFDGLKPLLLDCLG